MFYVYMLWTFYVRFAYPYHGYGTVVTNILDSDIIVSKFEFRKTIAFTFELMPLGKVCYNYK